MAAITKSIQEELDSLTGAAQSGHLPHYLNQFILQTVNAVYSAPGNFRTPEDIEKHLETLTYLINLHVYKRG